MVILDTYVQFEEKIITEQNKIGVSFFSEALKVFSEVLNVMTPERHGDFWKCEHTHKT